MWEFRGKPPILTLMIKPVEITIVTRSQSFIVFIGGGRGGGWEREGGRGGGRGSGGGRGEGEGEGEGGIR